MKERMLSFTGEMVRFILVDEKTHSRRVMDPQPKPYTKKEWPNIDPGFDYRSTLYPRNNIIHVCPYGRPGDRILVREKARVVKVNRKEPWAFNPFDKDIKCKLRYEADGTVSDWIKYPKRLGLVNVGDCIPNGCFKEAARIVLEITDVRVERLNDISWSDALKEGMDNFLYGGYDFSFMQYNDKPAVGNYRRLWNSIYAARGYDWTVNPYVWVIEFKRITK